MIGTGQLHMSEPQNGPIDPRAAPLEDVLRYVCERLQPSRRGNLWTICSACIGLTYVMYAHNTNESESPHPCLVCEKTGQIPAPVNIGDLMTAAHALGLYADVLCGTTGGWICSVYDGSPNFFRWPEKDHAGLLSETVIRAVGIALRAARMAE